MSTLEQILEKKPLTAAEAKDKLNPEYVADLGLKNLERDERIVFKVLQKPIVASDTSGQKKDIYKASQRVPNKCTVYDGKAMYEVSYPEEISFYRESNSEIVITGKEPHKFALLWFLRMSNNNLSNPYAIQGSEYIFEEVAELMKSQNALDKEVEVATLITFIKSKSLEDVAQLCKQLNVACGETQVEKQMALIEYIKNDTNRNRFRSTSINALGTIKELINKSIELDILSLDNETKMWSRRVDDRSIDIVQVSIGEDPKDFLVKYFISNDKGKKLKTFFEQKTISILAERKATQVGKNI
jgi:hypothetical protein